MTALAYMPPRPPARPGGHPCNRQILHPIPAGGSCFALAGALPVAAVPVVAAAAPAGDDAAGEVLALSLRLKALQRQHHQLDVAWLAAPAGPGKDAFYDRMDDVFAGVHEIQDRILLARSATVGDIAAQAAGIITCADDVYGNELTVTELKDAMDLITVAAASIARWALKASRIDPAELGFDDLTWQLETWAKGAEARANQAEAAA